MKKIYITIMIGILFGSGFAQSAKPKIAYLHAGDKMPDVTFAISNYKTGIAKISDFRNKLLILDFWGVYCGTCIMQMPKLEKLQNDFKDKIQIVRVCRDSREAVNKLMKRSEIVRDCKLPLVTGESGLAKMFELPSFPFYAWIEADGAIKYLTDDEITNAEGLAKYFHNDKTKVSEKVKTKVNYDHPMLTEDNPLLKKEYISYTYLAPADKKDSVHFKTVSINLDSNNFVQRYTCAPCDIPRLYMNVYNEGREHIYNNVVMDIPEADTILDKTQRYNTGRHKYAFDIELSHPKEKNGLFNYMRQQLDLSFGFHSSVQKRSVSCYILKRSGIEYLDSKYKMTDSVKSYEKDLEFMRFRYLSLRWVLYYMNRAKTPKIILDETGFDPDKIVDLNIRFDLFDLNKVNESLKRYGLVIEEGNRNLEMIVLEKPK